jgi:tetratricopeptide (TPR) repeat protein
VHVPDAAQLIAHMLELAASESTALFGGDDPDGRLAELNVRTALASWDALRQPEEALRLLELADAHPLAPRLRLMAAQDDVAVLAQIAHGATGARCIEVAEAWLWRHGQPDRAGEIADRLLAGELPPAWRTHVVELALLAHAAAANWPRVIELGTSVLTSDAPPDEVAATAALALDRGGDARTALELCWARLAQFPGRDGNALGWLRCLDIALDAATALADDRRFELLDQRATLIGALPGGELEALATRLTVAAALEAQGGAARAAKLWAELAGAEAALSPGALRSYANLRATWSAAAAGGPESHALKLSAHRWLADSACAEVALAHAWRALELAALVDDPAQGELARTVGDAVGLRSAERLLDFIDFIDLFDLGAPNPATIARFEARGGLALRWAAAAAERHDDTVHVPGPARSPARAPARAIDLWQRAAAAPGALPATHDHIVRLHRGGDDDALSAAYRAWATAESDVRCVAALWCASGIVDLARGDFVEAEESLRNAAGLAPGDPFCREALAAVYRAGKRYDQLAQVLAELSRLIASERQVAILLELGDVLWHRVNRASDAATAYEGVLERRPHDPTATAALEALYAQLGRDRELARLLETRAETVAGAPRALLLARVAALRAQRGDVDGAIAAYSAAFIADPANRDVFTAMERVCYQAERWAAAMQLYDHAIEHVEGGASRAYRLGDLYARRGNVLLNYLNQVDSAIASFQKVVEIDSQPQAAIKTLEDLCRKRGDWQPLIAAYEHRAETRRDPQSKSSALRAAAKLAREHGKDVQQSMLINRKLLEADPNDILAASTLERFYDDNQDRSALIEILKIRLSHAEGQAASVELLKRIAQVSEDDARDVETATEHYQKILELMPENRDALEALGRIYESTEQWAEFIDITRKQIKVTTDRTTRALLHFRCGSVMEAKFGREHDAIRYYEAAIKTSDACLPAIHGLRDLHRRREDWPLVIETLELEVKLWDDDKERAGVFAQIGRIYGHQLGDGERAMHYYESALRFDPDCLPANQAVFEHFFDQGAWDKAQRIADLLAQKAMRDGDPTTRSDFYRKRGVVVRMTGDPRAAAESFIVALEIRPGNGDALDDLGALARECPEAWDFDATYRELEKVYKKREDADALLARVHVGRAASRERDGDLDEAAQLYHQALELAPGDFAVLSALVEFHTGMRRWPEAIAAIKKFTESGAASAADRISALMRQAEIHADGELDTDRAIAVLREVIEADPSHQDGYYVLAQQYYLSARYPEARAAIDRVIELATASGQPLLPAALARYYYYKGRILDAAGDVRAAAPQYRRATEYDPGYAPPALVLALRAADAGDQRQAETLLIDAAHAAMAQGGLQAAVPLQRGLARILLASGDRPAAIEAYRGILNVAPDGASDRVALAEIYALDDPHKAISELRKVLDRDIHHAPAYRLLASFYRRTGDAERANRVLTALDLLGFAEDADRATMQRLKAARVAAPLRNKLDDDARRRLLITPAAREPLGEVFDALAQELSALVASPSLGTNLQPAIAAGDPRLIAIATEIGTLYQTQAEIFIGEKVPGLTAVTAFPRHLLVIDRSLLGESDLALRFLFGYAFEAIRGGYATLLQLGARQRRDLGDLLRALMSPEPERAGSATEFLSSLNPHTRQVVERHTGARDLDPDTWIDGMLVCAKRAGLVACDDFHAAIWTIALLAGEKLTSHHATVALGSVLGGRDLVRFYLSDSYQQIRNLLTA